jgi:hypothetical protein
LGKLVVTSGPVLDFDLHLDAADRFVGFVDDHFVGEDLRAESEAAPFGVQTDRAIDVRNAGAQIGVRGSAALGVKLGIDAQRMVDVARDLLVVLVVRVAQINAFEFARVIGVVFQIVKFPPKSVW